MLYGILLAQYNLHDIPLKLTSDLLGAIIGSGLVYVAIASAFPRQNSADNDRAEITSRVVVRWFVALMLAPLVFFTTYIISLWLELQVGNIFVLQSIQDTTVATMTGVTVGVVVVPPAHRSLGFWIFAAAANLGCLLSILNPAVFGQLRAADFLVLVGSISGSLLIWRSYAD